MESRDLPSADPTFGIGGLVSTDFPGPAPDRGWDLAVQLDGKIIAVGQADGIGGADFAVARYNPDGTLDPTFGTGGLVTTDFAGVPDRAHAVAIQADGRIVAAGATGLGFGGALGADFAVARYNPDGTLDPTFGTGGLVTTNSGFSVVGGLPDLDEAFDVVVQPDGKILVVGVAEAATEYGVHSDFLLVRYNPDGSLDASFDADVPEGLPAGLVTTNFGGLGALVVATVPNPAVPGAYSTFETTAFSEVLYGIPLPEGYALNDVARRVALSPDGTITVVGSTERFDHSFGAYAIARYATDGTLVRQMVANLGPVLDEIRGVVLVGDGDIVVAGGVLNADTGVNVGLMRYDPSGFPDSGFGGDGVVIDSFSLVGDVANDLVRQSDGRLVVAGVTDFTAGPPDEFGLDVGAPPYALGGSLFLARYTPDGVLDPTFDGDGSLVIALPAGDEQFHAAVLQTDGKLVAMGEAGEDFLLYRDTLSAAPPAPPPAGAPVPPPDPPAFYSGAEMIGTSLVLHGAGVPGGVAVVPMPLGSVAVFADLTGDAEGDVILFMPTVVVVIDGATGHLVALAADLTGDGVRDLVIFSPDGTPTGIDGRTGMIF